MNKKRYSDWVNDYPDRVVIKKEGFFYTTRENSAYIIATILDYNIGISEPEGAAITGSPSLVKMTEQLKQHHISYVAIVCDEVVDEDSFEDNKFWDFVDEDFAAKAYEIARNNIPKKGKENKSVDEVINDNNILLELTKALLDGVDPWSGELFEEDHFINCPTMKKILSIAQEAMKKQIKSQINKPSNANAAWPSEEEELLSERYNSGMSVKQIAELHGRSIGAIRSRLKRLGLIEY